MLRDDLKQAQIAAMKAGEKDRLAAVRLILAKVKDRDIEQRTSSKEIEDDALVIEVLQKMAKQRRESIELYEKGNREELAAKEEQESAMLQGYLPPQLTEDEVRALVRDAIAGGAKDLGSVMKAVMPRAKGKFDGKELNRIVRESLG